MTDNVVNHGNLTMNYLIISYRSQYKSGGMMSHEGDFRRCTPDINMMQSDRMHANPQDVTHTKTYFSIKNDYLCNTL